MHTVAIGCDPNAVEAKREMIAFLQEKGHTVTDFGSDDPIYANVAIKVARAVAAGTYDRGILICGTGIGVSLAANKVKGIRAAVVSETYSAEMTRLHNNANVLSLGGRVVGVGLALKIVETFISTPFEAGRHERRVDMLAAIEAKYPK